MTSPAELRGAPETLGQFIAANSAVIVAEWEEFAQTCFPQASLLERRDHIQGMLKAIVVDLEMPETAQEKADKAKGLGGSHVDSETAANAHGSDRAATGYTLVQMVSEFRALRASVLRLWSKTKTAFNATDFDEITRFNESIDQMLAESARKYSQDVDRSKDMLVGVLGHDLRNPLGSIMMSAEMIVRRAGPDWPHLRETSRIIKSSRRMDRMIGDLLDFTRVRLGSGLSIVRTDMDLQKLCLQAIDELTSFHPACVVHIDATGDLHGQWDHGRIAQVLSNLLTNAYQHGAERTPIDVVLRGDSDQEVVLTVHNQGTPIPHNALKAIFDPFRQLHPEQAESHKVRSLGLGLYIAQAITNAHGGTLAVESADKEGTTFTLRLKRRGPA